MLPISRGRDGVWQQSCSYSHPDLHDEVVVEVDGPFGSVGGVELIRLLICGDRNSGKSSLLHALSSHSGDRDWLLANSLLPSIAGSFVNVRFGQSGDFVPGNAPVDEPPYLDTDVARGTVICSREDFNFFAADFQLENVSISGDFVALELTEIGGDHLAEMMKEDFQRRPPLLSAALDKSLEVIRSTTRVAYFVNCLTLDKNELLEKLKWIRRHTSAGLTVFACRLPDDEAEDVAAAKAVFDEVRDSHLEQYSSVVGLSDDGDEVRRSVIHAFERDEIGTPFTRTLFGFLKANSIDVDRVRLARHVLSKKTANAAVDVPCLFSVLLALFDTQKHTLSPPHLLVADEIFSCAEDAATTTKDDSFDPWIDSERFSAWLDDNACCNNPSGRALPPQLALPHFESVARSLCDNNLLIPHLDAGHADVVLEPLGLSAFSFKREETNLTQPKTNDVLFYAGGGVGDFERRPSSRRDDAMMRVRAPLFPRLRHLVAKLVRHRLRRRDGTSGSASFPKALLADLRVVADKLDEALVDNYTKHIQDDDHESEVAVRSLLWLAEDRMQIEKLLRPDEKEVLLPLGAFTLRRSTKERVSPS